MTRGPITPSREIWDRVLHERGFRVSYSSLTPRNPFQRFMALDAQFRLFRDPFRWETGFGRILGLEITSGSSASEKAPARTSVASSRTSVRKGNLYSSTKLLTLHCISSDSRSKYSLLKSLRSRSSGTGASGVVL